MHTQATTGGLYCRQNVVKWRLRGRIHPRRQYKTETGEEREQTCRVRGLYTSKAVVDMMIKDVSSEL